MFIQADENERLRIMHRIVKRNVIFSAHLSETSTGIMNPFSKKEIFSLAVIFIFVFALVFGSRNLRLYSPAAITAEQTVSLLLDEPARLDELPGLLDSLEVDYDSEELLWAGRIHGWRNFRPGRYEINGGISYPDFLSKMARGIQDATMVTVLPGTDIDRLSMLLSLQLQADAGEFKEVFSDSSEVALELGLTGEELFSRMLPNTYQVYWTSSAENIIKRIHSEFETLISNRYQDQINQHRFNLNEIVTLASIVEWEARFKEEKAKISGLYLNRLDRNMRLQADPTVLYALGEKRRILFEDYQFDHPYNTYMNGGLPPGPITNPDETSIAAVLEPEEHDYLFMVATPEGGHAFTRTFEEHREVSEEWRRWIREQYRIRDQREREEAINASSPD